MTDEMKEEVIMADEGKTTKAKKQGRKAAPSINMDLISGDERLRKLEKLNAQDPDCVHLYQRGDISDAELAAKGLERVEGARHRGDIICRTSKESWNKYRKIKEQDAYEDVKAVNKKMTGQYRRSPKVAETTEEE